MKHEGILLHQFTIRDDKGKVVRTIKATKKTRKMLMRLSVVAKREWPDEEPFIVVLEPEYTDYGYVPRSAMLAKGKSVDETVPGSRNKYMISALNPATIKTCEQQELWEQDVEWFEQQVEKGNYVKVKVSYNRKGKVSVGAQVIKEARIKAVKEEKEAKKSDAKREDEVPPDIPTSAPTKEEKVKKEAKAKSRLRNLLSRKDKDKEDE